MKKLILAAAVLLLMAAGALWMVRRKPAVAPPAIDWTLGFQTSPEASGTLLKYIDPQTPLRALRWLPPLPGGWVVAQVNTQADRQHVALFKDGAFLGLFMVPKPQGVRDGFFRLAELRDARVVEGQAAVLLYAPADSSSGELPLVVALDLQTKDLRWFHRAAGEHLALGVPPDAAVYLWGAQSQPVRLPLGLASGESVNPAGLRSTARPVELPAEVQGISAFEPTGNGTFLVAHKGGLSAYLGAKGWQHQGLPEGNPGLFKDVQGRLGRTGRTYWWQPFPGFLWQVQADGTLKARWTPQELPTAAPFARDSVLLHLLGVDPEGRLWFDLATPSEVPPAAPAQPQSGDAPGQPEATPAPVLEDWSSYTSQGLARVYRWDSAHGRLERAKWEALGLPQGFQRPGTGFDPSAGVLLLAEGPSAWLAPLALVPLSDSSKTLPPAQVK